MYKYFLNTSEELVGFWNYLNSLCYRIAEYKRNLSAHSGCGQAYSYLAVFLNYFSIWNVHLKKRDKIRACKDITNANLSLCMYTFPSFIIKSIVLFLFTPGRNCDIKAILNLKYHRAEVPNILGTRDWFHRTQFSHKCGWDSGEWFREDSSIWHVLCILFLGLLCQLHLRSLGIRSQRLGAPAIVTPNCNLTSNLI